MKKLKIMLLSLALFAVVGGALAFKARFNTGYCTAPTFVQEGIDNVCLTTCPAFANSTTVNGNNLVCTTVPQNGKCDISGTPLNCNTTTLLTADH